MDGDLGELVWFTVLQSTRVPLGVMTEWFAELGLPEHTLPHDAVVPSHAFRRACQDFRVRYTLAEEAGAPEGEAPPVVTVRLAEVGHTYAKLMYHVMREVRREKVRGGGVSLTKVGEAVLYRPPRKPKASARLRITLMNRDVGGRELMPRAERDALADELDKLRTRYHELLGYHGANRVRGVLRDVLTLDLGAVLVRPAGGVYFVPSAARGAVERLQEVVERIGQGSTWHSVPVPDDPRQRRMVSGYFRDQVVGALEALRCRIEGRLDPARHRELENDYQAVAAVCERYAAIIPLPDEVVDALDATLETLLAAEQRIEI